MLALTQNPNQCQKLRKSVDLLCTTVLPPIERVLLFPQSKSDGLCTVAAVTDHIESWRHFQNFSSPLTVSINTMARTLLNSLKGNLASRNLTALCCSIFKEAPCVRNAVYGKVWGQLPPSVIFPVHSGYYLEETKAHVDCHTLHNISSQLNVSELYSAAS